MKIKLTVLIAVVLVLTFVLSGCSLEIKSPENLMRPPKLTGGYQDLQDTFESVVGSNVNLLTPMNGDCKSAFIIGDFNSDSKEDAMVFYSSKDGDDVANISVFEKRDGVWTYLKTVAGLGNSVDTVVVEDLNGDSVKEIIVGWNLYSLNKQFSVYEPDSSDQANFFVSLGSYQYNLFSVTDINSDSNKEIFFVSLNTSDNIHSASAGVLGFEGGNKLRMLGSTPIDGNVSGYSSIVTDSVDGKQVVLVDAYKNEHDMITDIIVWDSASGNITSPLFDAQTQTTSATWRDCRLPVSDIDGDSHPDIPVGVPIAGSSSVVGGELTGESFCYIRWSDFNGTKLKAKKYSLYNFSEGYMLNIPSSWVGKITLTSLDSQWYFYRWNSSGAEHMGDLLFSVVSHSTGTVSIEGYNHLSDYNDKTFEYQITESGKKFGITDENITKGFSLITEVQGVTTK